MRIQKAMMTAAVAAFSLGVSVQDSLPYHGNAGRSTHNTPPQTMLVPSHERYAGTTEGIGLSVGVLTALADAYMETHARIREDPTLAEMDLEMRLRGTLLLNGALAKIIEKDTTLPKEMRDAYSSLLREQKDATSKYLIEIGRSRRRPASPIITASMRYGAS